MNVTQILICLTLLLGNQSFALPIPWSTHGKASGVGTKFQEAREQGRRNLLRQRAAIEEECKADGGYLYLKIRTTGRCEEDALGKASCQYGENLSCLDKSLEVPPVLFSFPGWSESLEVLRRAPSRETAFEKAERELEIQRQLLEKICKEEKGKWWGISDHGGWWTQPLPGVAEAYLKTSAGNCYFDFPETERETK